MIFGKMWRALKAQFNKLANFFWSADPIAQMQYEYDSAVEELKSGRQGLEQYRALGRTSEPSGSADKRHVDNLEAKVKAYLKAGDRETAGRFAVELQKAKQQLQENESQLDMHEKAYDNNVRKIKHASKKLVRRPRQDRSLRRRTEDEQGGSRNGRTGPELRIRCDDRLRTD